MRFTSKFALVMLLCLVLTSPEFASANAFKNFSIPGAGTNSAAVPTAVNKWGTIVGYYSVDNGYDSFLWKTDGTVTTVAFPKMLITVATGVNSSGTAVGYYQSRTGAQIHGFIRNPKYTTLDAPFAGTSGGQGTKPLSINDAGEIAGVYWDSNSVEHGFVMDASGNYASFDVPGDSAVVSAFLNQNGEVAGTYLGPEPNLSPGGYVMGISGDITTVSVSGALYTEVFGINSSGEIAGQYYGAGGVYYGFVQSASGTVTTFSVSGLASVAGIADDGNVYGMSHTTTKWKGWKYTAAGALSYYEDPSAGSNGTDPLCVSSADQVAGTYLDSQGLSHDFEMTQ